MVYESSTLYICKILSIYMYTHAYIFMGIYKHTYGFHIHAYVHRQISICAPMLSIEEHKSNIYICIYLCLRTKTYTYKYIFTSIQEDRISPVRHCYQQRCTSQTFYVYSYLYIHISIHVLIYLCVYIQMDFMFMCTYIDRFPPARQRCQQDEISQRFIYMHTFMFT